MYKKVAKKIYHWSIPYEGNEHRPHFVRHKTLATYSALMIGVKVFILILLFLSYPSPAEFSTVTINHIVELTNEARQEQGLAPLKHNKLLNLSAQKKAEDMIKLDYFAHTSPENVKPWHWFKLAGYNYTYAGENLAINFVEAEDAIEAWMDSPTHRDNITSENYNDIGVAVVVGYVQDIY